jgi:aspartate/methionine/tyrosine aminotransferase
METASASEQAMDRFIANSPGLQDPQIYIKDPTLPTLPDLKQIAQARRKAGLPVIDQSAGDISDVGQPMNPDFYEWIKEERERLIAEGHTEFKETDHTPDGYPGNYRQQFPVVTAKLAESWGVRETPFQAVQTVSGRAAIDFALRGLLAQAEARGLKGKPAIILDPMAWSGYQPLANDLGITIIQAPAVQGHGLSNSSEGVIAAELMATKQGLDPIAVIPILPSNPTGVGMDRQELADLIQAVKMPVLIDGFYSPIHPDGHQEAVPLGWLEQYLTPEQLSQVGVIVGETKVISSQKKTGSLIWMAPEEHDATAQMIVRTAIKRLSTTNSYPRPDEAMAAYALHTFPEGIHAAMGPRYEALNQARAAMRAAADELGLPLSIGGSFYGTIALVDPSGESLIRSKDGRVITDPKEAITTLTDQFGLVGAPGSMFSAAPEASKMARLSAAVTLEDVSRVKGIFAQMLDDAKRHG